MSSARDLRSAVVLLGMLAACGNPTDPPSAGASGSSATSGSAAAPASEPMPRVQRYTAPPAPTVITMDEPKIELPRQESFQLIRAGTGARARLRYALAAGTVSFTTRTQLSSRHLEAGQLSAPAALPAIRDGFAITVAADAPHRLGLRALPGESATPSPDADAYLATWRTLLQGRTITVAIDDRGQLSTITFNDDPTHARGAQAKDELIQRLLSTIVPLPAEPVADGASWRVVTILRQGPAYAKQTATYTLTSHTGAAWKLHVVLKRVGEEQRIADPALPAGTTADLLALFRVLEGDVELDAAHPLITAGTLTIESRMHVRLMPSGAPATEQIFEDTGTATFSHQP